MITVEQEKYFLKMLPRSLKELGVYSDDDFYRISHTKRKIIVQINEFKTNFFSFGYDLHEIVAFEYYSFLTREKEFASIEKLKQASLRNHRRAKTCVKNANNQYNLIKRRRDEIDG